MTQKTAEIRLAERRRLRKMLIERRLALPDADCVRHSARIRALLREHFPQLAGMRVAFCWPVSKEPDLRPLLAAWADESGADGPEGGVEAETGARGENGFCALLPVVVAENAPLAFRAWTPRTPLVADRYGIPTPAAGAFVAPTALLLPVNAFDAAGYRIGYGGGYFDRTLAALASGPGPAPLAIGVGYELARVATIHPEPHDLPLAAVVTEAGVFRTPAPPASPRR